jgi:hypothetical protein
LLISSSISDPTVGRNPGRSQLRIGDVLYFSPRFPFAKLNLDDPATLIEAIRDRVEGFYLQPAARCLASHEAFAGGLICCAAIDFLTIVYGEKSPSGWLKAHVPAFIENDEIAEWFWIRFRHGLMHEGYIKSQGQFSQEVPEVVIIDGPVMVVNPRMLLEQIQVAFSDYCKAFTPAQAEQLARRLHRYFDAEIKAAKTPSGSQEQTDEPHAAPV